MRERSQGAFRFHFMVEVGLASRALYQAELHRRQTKSHFKTQHTNPPQAEKFMQISASEIYSERQKPLISGAPFCFFASRETLLRCAPGDAKTNFWHYIHSLICNVILLLCRNEWAECANVSSWGVRRVAF